MAVKTRIIKRNGKEVDFDVEKITNAISKANDEMDRIHQLSEYQIEAIASRSRRKLRSQHMQCMWKTSRYGRDRDHGDARIRSGTEVCRYRYEELQEKVEHDRQRNPCIIGAYQ